MKQYLNYNVSYNIYCISFLPSTGIKKRKRVKGTLHGIIINFIINYIPKNLNLQKNLKPNCQFEVYYNIYWKCEKSEVYYVIIFNTPRPQIIFFPNILIRWKRYMVQLKEIPMTLETNTTSVLNNFSTDA